MGEEEHEASDLDNPSNRVVESQAFLFTLEVDQFDVFEESKQSYDSDDS